MNFFLSLIVALIYTATARAEIPSSAKHNAEDLWYINGEGSTEFTEFVDEVCNNSEFHCYPANPIQPNFGDPFVKYLALNDESATIITLKNSEFDEAIALYNSVGTPFRGLHSLLYLSNNGSKEFADQIAKAEILRDACDTASQACMLAATLAMAKRDRLGFAAFMICSYAGNSCETRMDSYIAKLKSEKEQKESEEKQKEKEKKEREPSSHGGTGPGAEGGGNRDAEGASGIPADKPLPGGTVTITDHPDRNTGFGCSHIRCFPL